jgi:alpha-L-fucosidase
MKTIQPSIILWAALTGVLLAGPDAIDTTKIPDAVRARQITEMNWGMFICWSLSTFSGTEWTRGVSDVNFFKATGCDTDQWCETAKAADMGYILFLAKHHDGFCLWDTKTTDFKVKNSPLGIDVLAKLRASCDKYGIKLALYFSEGDWTWIQDDLPKGSPAFLNAREQRKNNIWKTSQNPELKRAQLKELCTRYGPIEFFWMDHAQGDGGMSHGETTEWIHRFQPNTFVGFNSGEPAGRLLLRERGQPGEVKNLNATKYNRNMLASSHNFLVAEFTYPILPPHQGGANWFYSLPKHDDLCHPAEKLYRDYSGAVKYGNIFSINVGPNYEGRLREVDVKTLSEVGRIIRKASCSSAR